MYDELDQQYLEALENLAAEIQESEELSNYLEDEEEEDYLRLKEAFEPKIAAIYDEVAAKFPLHLIHLELLLLDPLFEGLYLPKILGYSVLRGEISPDYHYTRPQDHFREVLLAICNSTNFEILKKRIGQSIQMGFAMSSDIWVTNLINSITNKRVRYFLQSQKLDRYRSPQERALGYQRYRKQFQHDNFQSAEFPETLSQLKVFFPQLKHFLIYRIRTKADNASLTPPLIDFVSNGSLQGSEEYLQIAMLFGGFFDLSPEAFQQVKKEFNKVRKAMPEFDEKVMSFILELHHDPDIDLHPAADQQLSGLCDRKIKDQLGEFFDLTDTIHTKGYTTPEVQEAVHAFYNRHEGLSLVNECVRAVILRYFTALIDHLEVEEYPELFEIAKLFPVYISIFANQKFNQDLKDTSMAYVSRLLKHFTDKRGKDYQDIKKFVSTTFVDLNFLTEKEVVELFKTRRKRKKKEE